MSANGRGPCSVCGRDMAIKADGGVHVHHVGRIRDSVICDGSGKPPKRADLHPQGETVAWRRLWAQVWSHHAAVCFGRGHDCMQATEDRATELYQEIAKEVLGQ